MEANDDIHNLSRNVRKRTFRYVMSPAKIQISLHMNLRWAHTSVASRTHTYIILIPLNRTFI